MKAPALHFFLSAARGAGGSLKGSKAVNMGIKTMFKSEAKCSSVRKKAMKRRRV
jgi:hypothetical protein